MVNKNYSLVTIIIVVLVVAIIASLITVSITGNVIKVRGDRIGAEIYTKAEVDAKFANIKANSCDADSVCEVAKTISTGKGSTNNLIIKSDTKNVVIEGALTLKSEKDSKGVVFNTILDQLLVDALLTRFKGEVGFNKLIGDGNAYVCINYKGIIFRSLVPCNMVQQSNSSNTVQQSNSTSNTVQQSNSSNTVQQSNSSS